MTTIVSAYNGFKLGDKVRINSADDTTYGGFHSHNVGKTGIITEFDPGVTLDIKVALFGGDTMYDWGNLTQISLVQTKEPASSSILQRLAALETEIAAIKSLIG